MPSRLSSAIALIVLACVVTTATLSAQGTSVLRGRVTDPQSAVVAGAAVTVTIEATGAKRTAISDAEGGFVVAELPPGLVSVEVNATGFATQLLEHVSVAVGQTRDLEIPLAVAGVRETITIDESDAVQQVDTVTSAVDAVIGQREIASLPLNGRNYLELALLVPGNTAAPNFDPTKTNTVLISSAGQLGRGSAVTLDGADNNDDVVGGSLQNLPQDAVQEFQMATARYSAELGRSASSTINVVTRSGTSELRGEGSIFFRDDSLQGLPATFDRSNPDPPFDRQQYAISAGGPLKKSSVFAFGALEYRDQDGGILVGTRDLASRTFKRDFAPAPADDLLGLARLDWVPNGTHKLTVRYGGERAKDVASSARDRALGSASQRQEGLNKYHNLLGTWTWVPSSTSVNALSISVGTFDNHIDPLGSGPQQTFPSFLDGFSFRVPQGTTQDRFEIADTYTRVLSGHTLRFGGQAQWVNGLFDLDVFRAGRIEYVQNFPAYDANGDGRVNDDDTLFAVTLRSGHPDQGLTLADNKNTHVALFAQDDWRVLPNLTINVGLRYELDTDVKNISRYDEINPIVKPFLQGDRDKDANNLAPRIGFNWATRDGRTSITGGYGIYYDRITLEIMSLERGLDGRALPIEVRAGNLFFIDPGTGQFPPFAPTTSNPFTGFILPGAGAGGINIIDNTMQNPTVQQFSLGVERQFGKTLVVRANGIHAHGTQFIIGRKIGEVFNPVVGGPDTVLNLESSVGTKYDALLLSAERRDARSNLRASYTLGKAFNYANDDQIPFSNGPIDPNDLQREYGPTPNDRRHLFTLAGSWSLPYRFQVSTIWSMASGVPMDILLPGAQSRIPVIQRNAGNRQFKSASELNAFIRDLNAGGGVDGVRLPLVSDSARFGDSLNSLDARVTKTWSIGPRGRIDGIVEVFNIFNVTNVLGVSTSNYSGFSNVLVRDSEQPGDPGFLTSSSFGRAVTTAGGVFGTGGPRAFQLAVRASF
jgi:Carboxypeptidase regulatory-like domain/TonB dependent receptor